MNTKLTAVIPINTLEGARILIDKAGGKADILELRFDCLRGENWNRIETFINSINQPIMITVRSHPQGGQFQGTEEERLALIKKLITFQPDYCDIESDVPDAFISNLHILSPDTQLIRSHHDFNETPDLEQLYQSMQHPDIAIYKLVAKANSSLDALRMMQFVKEQSKQHQLVGHCIGEYGIPTRIAGAVLGNCITYAAIDEKTAVLKHQVSLDDLHNIYHIKDKNVSTLLYGLIGDPIDKSLGHVFHNAYFHDHHMNALYLKFKLTAQELPKFFEQIEVFPFQGFSVTMPLKKSVIEFAQNHTGLQAANTLKKIKGEFHAYNTDGIGALDAIEDIITVKNKQVLVLGAGGAAIAIIDESIKRGAQITLANRTRQNAEQLVYNRNIPIIDFNQPADTQFDLVINTLPNAVYEHSNLVDWLQPILTHQPTVMDVNYNQAENRVKQLVESYRCAYIPGDLMFTNQGIAQQEYWSD